MPTHDRATPEQLQVMEQVSEMVRKALYGTKQKEGGALQVLGDFWILEGQVESMLGAMGYDTSSLSTEGLKIGKLRFKDPNDPILKQACAFCGAIRSGVTDNTPPLVNKVAISMGNTLAKLMDLPLIDKLRDAPDPAAAQKAFISDSFHTTTAGQLYRGMIHAVEVDGISREAVENLRRQTPPPPGRSSRF